MFTAALIVFREVFEIAIIVCVILAATKQVPKRNYWIGAGILGGTALVAALACFAPYISALASQLGEHVFHAFVLFVASTLIIWSLLWMKQHGREIATHMKEVSQAVTNGKTPLYMLSVVTGLAVLREGSEIVLFLYGIYSTGEASMNDILGGGFLGVCMGIATAIIMYLGLVRIPVKKLFSVSSWLLAFLAAGMIAKGVGHLIQANILPAIINPIWNTSSILSQHSLVGRFLSTLFGYQDHPAAMQVIFYLATLGLVSTRLSSSTK